MTFFSYQKKYVNSFRRLDNVHNNYENQNILSAKKEREKKEKSLFELWRHITSDMDVLACS